LRQRRKLLDGVVISGGEPTVQSDLPEFIRQVRQMGYQIKLDTNGSRPEVINMLLRENLVDFIAMDIKATTQKYSLLAGVSINIENILESIRIIESSGCKVIFRTTWVKALLTQDDLSLIKKLIPDRAEYKVQTFVPENALDLNLRKYESYMTI
jgi:pyruvate formate lyase activating enzyme